MFILFVVIEFIILFIAGTLLLALFKGAPYVPTKKTDIKKMFEMAGLKAGETVLDIGSGDGRILIVAAKEFHAKCIGIEVTWLYYLWSRVKIAMQGLTKDIAIKRANMYETSFGNPDVVVLFLLQDTNQKLKERLQQELPQGTRIISRYFTFADWSPVEVDSERRLYLYINDPNYYS